MSENKSGFNAFDGILPMEAQAWLAAIVESSDDAIISKTLDGIVTTWNHGAQRIFGYTAEEIVGKPIKTLLPVDRKEEEDQILQRLRRGERVDHFQTVRVTKDGRLIDVSLTISPVRNSSGQIAGASKIARDITDQKRLERELQFAKEAAETANRAKDQFLSVLSHELRTPLNAVVGWTHLLRAGARKDPETLQAVDAIERNARTQTQIIEDLLDMSRIVSGKIRLDVQKVDLLRVIESSIETILPAAENKRIRLDKMLDPLAGQVRGDPNRLQQIVTNLLTNAVKFTPQGGRVQVALERVNSHVEIVVSDTGIGIPPEFLPHVFERFLQADTSTTRRHGGLGLGLSIVKNLVELHGGTVRAKSSGEGQGSTFIIALPLMMLKDEAREHPTRSHGDDLKHAQPVLQGVRILFVDDEPDARELVRRVLTQANAHVTIAASGHEALEAIKSNAGLDVILSDIGMPDMDGYELIHSIRTLGIKTPAAAITAFARPEDRRRALLSGYQTHVAKPLEPLELIAVVAALAGKTSIE